jgi:rfaE bifunctional protein nucleotidyltransferase chain/domain
MSADLPAELSPTHRRQWAELLALRKRLKGEGKVVVWANGCFDLLHAGHIQYLEEAKRQGDVLIVGVNSDSSVRELKGPGRPILPLEERIRLLEALRPADFVVPFEGMTPEAAIAELRPDVAVKGSDYAPPSAKPMPERALVESYGGRVEFVRLLPGRSTSDLIRQIREIGIPQR